MSVPFCCWAEVHNAGSDESPEVKKVKIYSSPSERREAGFGTELTDWLKFSGLVELEKEYRKDKYSGSVDVTESDRPAQSVQFGFNVDLFGWLEGEFVFEVENDKRYHSRLDEGLIGLELDPWGVKFGKLYVPFGEYYSHFVIGPMLEFGETRASSVIIDYAFAETIEVAGYVFNSKVDEVDEGENTDWGVNLEITSEDESIRFGAGYLSDLSETEEPLLEDERAYERRVSAWNAYLLFGMNQFEFTAEIVKANRSFSELDSNADKPVAWNLELAYFPRDAMQLAARIEHSDEFEDNPEWRYGVSVTWRLSRNLGVSFDYLYADFKSGFVVDDDDNKLGHSHQMAAQFSFEF